MKKIHKFLSIFLLSIILSNFSIALQYSKDQIIKLIPNVFSSSNTFKVKEYEKFFHTYNHKLHIVHNALPEIDSDPVSVAAFKASMTGSDIIVEDTSLEINGADIGVNLKHKVNEIHFYVNQPAIYRVMLAFLHKGEVYVFEGKLEGKIVAPKDEKDKYELNAIFLPNGQNKTLSENMPNDLNVRYLAVKNLFEGNIIAVLPEMKYWRGPWQVYP